MGPCYRASCCHSSSCQRRWFAENLVQLSVTECVLSFLPARGLNRLTGQRVHSIFCHLQKKMLRHCLRIWSSFLPSSAVPLFIHFVHCIQCFLLQSIYSPLPAKSVPTQNILFCRIWPKRTYISLSFFIHLTDIYNPSIGLIALMYFLQ